MRSNTWTKFTTDSGLVGGYKIVDGEVHLKLFTGVSRRFYCSCYNEIGDWYDAKIKK
jgi:hypothetical protein